MKTLDSETRRKMRELKIPEAIDVLEDQEKLAMYTSMSFDERFARLVDTVYQKQYNKKVLRLIKNAHFRISQASFNNIEYQGRGLDKGKLANIATLNFIDNYQNIIFEGCTGGGKTYLSCAVGKLACERGIRTFYIRLPDLLRLKAESMVDPKGESKLLKKFGNFEMLIIDEWLFRPLGEHELLFLFELLERRHTRTSTIFATQYRQSEWFEQFSGGDDETTVSEACLDRIVHNAIWVNVGERNMRENLSLE